MWPLYTVVLCALVFMSYSFASLIPPGVIANVASFSGISGLHLKRKTNLICNLVTYHKFLQYELHLSPFLG